MTPEPDTSPASGGQESKPGPDKARTPPASPRPPKRLPLMSLLFALAVAGGFGYGGFILYEQDKAIKILFDQQNAVADQHTRDDNRIVQLQEGMAALETALASSREENLALITAQNAELERLQGELVSTRLRISSNETGTNQEILLSEAASLLRLAERQMINAVNTRTAIALYVAADDILKQVDDPAIFPVRESLAAELASIRAVPEIDIQSIYLQLGGLLGLLDRLEVNADLDEQIAEGEIVNPVTAEEAEGKSWLASLQDLFNNYVVIRRRDAPIQPLLTPAQEFTLVQSIRLQIEQGRTALLRGQQEIFASSLGAARGNIERYLGGDRTAKASLLGDLELLADADIVADMPPVSGARAALERILRVSAGARNEAVDGQ